MYFSRRNATQPLPPLPASTRTSHSSMKRIAWGGYLALLWRRSCQDRGGGSARRLERQIRAVLHRLALRGGARMLVEGIERGEHRFQAESLRSGLQKNVRNPRQLERGRFAKVQLALGESLEGREAFGLVQLLFLDALELAAQLEKSFMQILAQRADAPEHRVQLHDALLDAIGVIWS